MHAVTLRVLGDRGLAEEATQQTFVQAWRRAQRFDPSRELGPWLATIAKRVAIDVHRRKVRRMGTLVPIGTFHDGDHVVLWAGVALEQFPTLTVTEEDADGNQASSGRRVLVGTVGG